MAYVRMIANLINYEGLSLADLRRNVLYHNHVALQRKIRRKWSQYFDYAIGVGGSGKR